MISIFSKFPKPLRQPGILIAIGVLTVGLGSWATVSSSGDDPVAKADAFHTAVAGPFTISLPAGGSLEALNEVKIRNEVPGRTRIISLVKEGSVVEQGDLLIELDANEIENELSKAEIAFQQSLSSLAELEERFEILRSENEIKLRDAELAAEFAINDLKKYQEGELPQLRNQADSAISLASEELRRAQDRLDGTRRLEEKGYATSSELVADELAVKRREIELETAEEKRRMLIEFDAPRTRRQLETNVENTKARLESTRNQNSTKIEKSKTQLASYRETLALREEKLKELRDAREFTKIYAPQSGLVVYQKPERWRSDPVEEGSEVRERQNLISLPDISRMKVMVNIYENQISLVKPGMNAHISLDALPDQRFAGEVISIASMPEPARDGNPNYRVYKAEVLVTDEMPEIKPGVTARVDILVAELDDVIKVPLQAVIGVDDRQFCFVHRSGKQVPVEVKVGLFDSDFVEIRSGVEEGDLVSLTPPTSYDIAPTADEPSVEDPGYESPSNLLSSAP